MKSITEPLPDLTDREVVQMMAAQSVLMNHYEELDDEYKSQIREYADRYDVEIPDSAFE